MTSDASDKQVYEVVGRFYEAIEDLIAGRGGEKMRSVWHHSPDVSSAHPTGDWANGWAEVSATWDVVESIGKAGNGGSSVHNIRVHRYGDTAYTTCVFQVAPSWGGGKLNCTNVLVRVGGEWKIVHHHADRAPNMDASLEKMA
jgi:ketosteroid isomerase-like protein